jgi:hypothetical protein
MIRSNRWLPLALGTLILANGSLAAADTSAGAAAEEPHKRMADRVYRHVFDSVLRVLSPQDVLRLVLVAQQSAIAETCDGYARDEERFHAVMQDITGELSAATAEGQNNLPVDVVMSGYATALGGQLAIAGYDTEAFCSRAAELRAALEKDASGRVLVWKSPEAAAEEVRP